jgi:import receptor subunit TOM70
MSSEPAASVTPSSSSLWDRITSWASENKAIVYTIAGTAVIITGAGAVYYLSDSRRTKTMPSAEKKKSKKERRSDKKKAEEQSKPGTGLKDEEAGTRSSVHLMDSSH